MCIWLQSDIDMKYSHSMIVNRHILFRSMLGFREYYLTF